MDDSLKTLVDETQIDSEENNYIIDFDLDDICLLYRSVTKHLEVLKADEDRDRDGLDERLEDLQMHLYKTILECKMLGDFE